MKVGDLVMKRQPSKRKPIGIIVRAFGESNVLLVQWMAGGRLRTTAGSLLLVSES